MTSRKAKRAASKKMAERVPSESSSDTQPREAAFDLRWVLAALLIGLGIWGYLPSLIEMTTAWSDEADYSHGYLVIPIAIAILWSRRDQLPQIATTPAWGGISLILLAIGIRFCGGYFFLGSVDAWSIPIWIAGVVWVLWGMRALIWASPAITFLYFMIPFPFRMERLLSYPLQTAATKLSTAVLQTIGYPAIAEGHTILLYENVLEVEQACSGLRIFIGAFAMGFAVAFLTRWSWWERAIVILASLPIALVVNACRIVMTGILLSHLSGESARKFSHDLAGWIMIPLAASLLILFAIYLKKVIADVEEYDSGSILEESVEA